MQYLLLICPVDCGARLLWESFSAANERLSPALLAICTHSALAVAYGHAGGTYVNTQAASC